MPNPAYEAALTGFVQRLLRRGDDAPFLPDVQALGATLAWYGALNSLSMTLLKYCSPGVPDLYQGNELMDLSLVDPDNRRPVDYTLRSRWLDELDAMGSEPGLPEAVEALAAAPHDGRAKLWLTRRLLGLRQAHPTLFRDGGYTALAIAGGKSSHLVAFARRHDAQTLIVLAGRLFTSLPVEADTLPIGNAAWGDTMVKMPHWPDGARFENVLTGETLTVANGGLRVDAALAHFPGAALLAL